MNQLESLLARRTAAEFSGQPWPDVPAASALFPNQVGDQAECVCLSFKVVYTLTHTRTHTCIRTLEERKRVSSMVRNERVEFAELPLSCAPDKRRFVQTRMNQCSSRVLTFTDAPPSPPPESLMSHLFTSVAVPSVLLLFLSSRDMSCCAS